MKRVRLSEALAAAGAVLKRQKKHLVYALPNGKALTVSATPSDDRSEDNALADLRHALGVTPKQAVVNPRRVRSPKPGRRDVDYLAVPGRMSPLAAALKDSGVQTESELAKSQDMEKRLRWRIAGLETELLVASRQIAALEALWVVRLYRKLQRTFPILARGQTE